MDPKEAFESMSKEERDEIIRRAEFVHERDRKAKALLHRQLLAAQCSMAAVTQLGDGPSFDSDVARAALSLADEIIRQSEESK